MLIFILGAIISFMVFFPTIVAPIIFKTLKEAEAGAFLRLFFPRYYLYGLILSSIGLIQSIIDKELINIIIFVILFVTFIFSRQVITPAINRAKDSMVNNVKKSKVKFEKLHSFSVAINFFQLIICIFLLMNLLFFKYSF